jgi:hypothetical protein
MMHNASRHDALRTGKMGAPFHGMEDVKGNQEQEFPHFCLRLAPFMQACGTRASAALALRPFGRTLPRCMPLKMNKRELFGPLPLGWRTAPISILQ